MPETTNVADVPAIARRWGWPGDVPMQPLHKMPYDVACHDVHALLDDLTRTRQEVIRLQGDVFRLEGDVAAAKGAMQGFVSDVGSLALRYQMPSDRAR